MSKYLGPSLTRIALETNQALSFYECETYGLVRKALLAKFHMNAETYDYK